MSQHDPRLDPTPVGPPQLTRRQLLGRRIELAAGIAAAGLALIGLALLLFAPVLPPAAMCPGRIACTANPSRYVSALQAPLGFDAWALILSPLLLALTGGVGAVADARYGVRAGLFALGLASALAAFVCLAASAGVVGALYFPATLALALSAYGAFLARSPARPTSGADVAKPPEPSDHAEP